MVKIGGAAEAEREREGEGMLNDIPIRYELSKLGMTVASQEFDRIGRHDCISTREGILEKMM